MHSKSWLIPLEWRMVAALLILAAAGQAGTFGTVVDIGGHATDIALDERRGVLYIADFTGNRIHEMSLFDLRVSRAFHVARQPGSLSLSPDGRYLVVAHYGKHEEPNPQNNLLTVIDLESGNAGRTFAVSSPPLGVAFGVANRALVVTTTAFLLFDPASGRTQVLQTVEEMAAKTLPQPLATPPVEIVATSMAASGDGVYVYGVTDTFQFRYDFRYGRLQAGAYTATPELGPRAVSVNQDGSAWIAGWTLNNANFWVISQFPNVTGALEVGSVQIDSHRNRIYAQMGEPDATVPILYVADADNLTIRERLVLQENLAGKSVMSRDGRTMYAVSESGVTILPLHNLDNESRIVQSTEDLLFRGSFCDRSTAVQEFTLNHFGPPAAFRITSPHSGVRVSPSSGTTPATIRVFVDPSSFSAHTGTATVPLTIESADAINKVPSVRVAVNSREPDQRGTLVNIPGKLVDLLADPQRDRFYVLRQDTNEVLVFDASNLTETMRLRTYNTPKSMAITFDRRYLLVGCDNSHLINVYDLETMKPDRPISVGDYVQSIAASANAILAATRSAGGTDNKIHRVDLESRSTVALATLGVFENDIQKDTVVIAAPNGKSILIAQSDGNLMLYDAVADTFTISRKESTPLLGAYAASNYDKFAVGNALLNASLVPVQRFETGTGKTAGFAFAGDGLAFRLTAPSESAPGVLSRVEVGTGGLLRPTRTIEAPVLGTTDAAFTRALALLPERSVIVALTTSGVTVLPWEYDAATVPPRIDRIVNAADLTQAVAPGGLISVLGAHLSPVSQASSQLPLPTALADTCLSVNGMPVPMILASPERINAQLPLGVEGSTTLVLRTPGGVSNDIRVAIESAAPSIFHTGVAGPRTDIPAVVRAYNNDLVTLSNPVRHGDLLTIYATGLGATSPAVDPGAPAPFHPLAVAVVPPQVTLGGVPLEVLYAGLAPGQVGVYQINVRVNGGVPAGMQIPLTISQGTASTSLLVRVNK